MGLAAAYRALGPVLSNRPREAEKAFREALKLSEKAAAERRDQTRYRIHVAYSYYDLGVFLTGVGQSHDAESAFQNAIGRLEQSSRRSNPWGEGWLRVGLGGHQPGIAEAYISTGSLYLCTAAFLPLGLSARERARRNPAR